LETNDNKSKDYYSIGIDDILKELNTTREGLSDKEAEKRLKEHGYNQLRNKKPKTILELVWKEITDPMILILLGAVLLSVILHEWVEAWVILVIVFVNTIISVAQEKKAEASIEALKSMSSPLARVYRQGEESHISSKELVARRYCNIRGWQHGSSRHKIDRVFKFKSTRGVFNRRICACGKGRRRNCKAVEVH